MNVALYGEQKRAWSLRERAISPSDRSSDGVAIGPSSMRWQGDRLRVEIDERTTPFGRSLRGSVTLYPELCTGLSLRIDERGEHRWWPVSPLARIEVDLPEPGVRFTGHGYYDANAGPVPLESAFETWSWSRARSDDLAFLTYDLKSSAGPRHSLAFKVSARGEVADLDPVWSASLRRSYWGLTREARVDAGEPCRIVRSLEDGPFYSRALVATRFDGRPVLAMHEALAAHRLRRRWVQRLVEYRMRPTLLGL